MYVLRRFSFKNVLIWTRKELIFFIFLASTYTALYELLNVKWLQIPLTPVGLIGTAVGFFNWFSK